MAGVGSRNGRPPDEFGVEVDMIERVLYVRGDIDAETGPLMLEAAIRMHEATRGDLTLDLSDVTLADSSLLSAVRTLRTAMELDERRVWIDEPSAVVKRLFLAAGSSHLLQGPPSRLNPERR